MGPSPLIGFNNSDARLHIDGSETFEHVSLVLYLLYSIRRTYAALAGEISEAVNATRMRADLTMAVVSLKGGNAKEKQASVALRLVIEFRAATGIRRPIFALFNSLCLFDSFGACLREYHEKQASLGTSLLLDRSSIIKGSRGVSSSSARVSKIQISWQIEAIYPRLYSKKKDKLVARSASLLISCRMPYISGEKIRRKRCFSRSSCERQGSRQIENEMIRGNIDPEPF